VELDTVDDYIAAAPGDAREKLRTLRQTILEAVPDATERISYKMPYYDYHGRLVYFGLAKRHIGLYIPTPIIDEHKEELVGYHATQATIHLPLDRELPISLIQKLVKARALRNEEAR
jgi:uncharacterized protein YdhG (YjbR/CyaY superfamily)